MTLQASSQGEVPSGSAASIVHDLGNLIQIASSAIGIVARIPDMPAVHSGAILDRAKNALEQAGAIVRQSLGHARLASVERASVPACLADVAALIETMDASGLSLKIAYEPDLPPLQCDPIGLRRALLNLFFNARDAIAGKGIVLIEVRAIRRESDGAEVELRVVDDGVGMTPDTLARAFDPFFTTKPDGLGGVGLPMVERFVRDAGGDIAIESAPGLGTTVILRLPAVAGAGSISEELER